MPLTGKELYVYKMPEVQKHRYYIGQMEDPFAKECKAIIVAGPFATMDLSEPPITDNGWDIACTWIKLNDRVAFNFYLGRYPVWDQIEEIVSGVSYFDDMRTSWHSWAVIKWPEKLPEYYVHSPNQLFVEELLSKYGMERDHASHAGQAFADVGHVEVDKNRQLIHMTQMGGLDI